jgi:hypothetical protein
MTGMSVRLVGPLKDFGIIQREAFLKHEIIYREALREPSFVVYMRFKGGKKNRSETCFSRLSPLDILAIL